MGSRVIAGFAALGMASAMWMAPAAADPKNETFEIACDDGATYTIVTTESQGEFTPGFDTESNSVIVPVSFGDFVIKDSSGEIVFEESGTFSKGQSAERVKNLVECTFSFTFEEQGETFTGTGTVVAKITPSRQ